MDHIRYVMFINKSKTYNKINSEMVIKHVDYIRNLDDNGKLEFCGAFQGYPGVAGMLILKVASYEEAEDVCKAEPFVAGGYATYELRTLQAANRENNFLM